jgi:hypothetical protein
VTFLAIGGLVRLGKSVQNEDEGMDEPIEITMSVEAFFRRNWSHHIRGFRFQNDALPPLIEWCQQASTRSSKGLSTLKEAMRAAISASV